MPANLSFAAIGSAGIVMAFALAIPIGPTSLFCLHPMVQQGLCAGLVSGFGVATASRPLRSWAVRLRLRPLKSAS